MPKCKSIKKLIPATCAWVLLLSTTVVFFIFPGRKLQEEYHISVLIVQAIIAFFVISNLFATTFVDPGIIKRANPDEDKDDFRAPLHKEVQIRGHTVRMKWCSTCQFYRPPRCSHCSVCDNCIEKFDHHCPWVNNCIGRRNYRHFFFFLIFLTIHMVSVFIWCLLFVINNSNKLQETAVIVSIVLIVIITIFFIPIVGLTGFHIVLVARGRTTNEQVTKKFNRQVNPFSEGIVYNCIYTLCGPRYSGLYTSKIQKYSVDEPDIRIFIDPKLENEEKKIDDNNFSTVENHKDTLMEMLECPINKNNESFNNYECSLKNYNGSSDEQYQQEMMYNINGIKDANDGHIVTMHQENGTKETTFIALQSKPNEIFQRYNNKSKSSSINEMTHIGPTNHDTISGISGNGPDGGMLIYYSPDAGGGAYISTNNKFNSETELQKYKNSQFLYIDEQPPYDLSDPHTYHNNHQQSHHHHTHYYKRPMPFQKALEISNKLEQQNKKQNSIKNNDNTNSNNNNRQSQYEMNYEISV